MFANEYTGPLGIDSFGEISRRAGSASIDSDARLKNLAQGDWRYDGMLLPALKRNGWIRFAAGFKAGVYAHPQQEWCLKIIGMGVGDNPAYFAGRGYYLEHEQRMLNAFHEHGFRFQPRVKSLGESIDYLIDQGIDRDQAAWQCESGHVLVLEQVVGVPFATQTGHFLCYHPDIAIFDPGVLRLAERALDRLRVSLDAANVEGLVHNDPTPANIVFSLDGHNRLLARLVDFELAQDLNQASPAYVSEHVRELYAEREVPANERTGRHTRNLDQHVLEQSRSALAQIRGCVDLLAERSPDFDWLTVSLSFVGGISINVGRAVKYWRERLARH